MLSADGAERVIFASGPAAGLYECDSEKEFLALISSRFQNMMVPEDYKPVAEIANPDTGRFHLTYHYLTRQKHFRKAEAVGSLRDTAFGRVYLVQFFSDEQIAEDRKSDENTDLLGMHDFFREALRRAVVRKEDGTLGKFCPVSLDVTRFKEYNRLYGMHRGDQCIRRIAETITEHFPGALVGHLMADHFVALLPSDDLERKLEQVCNEVNLYIDNDAIQLKAGIYRPTGHDSMEDLRHAFDMAKIACDSIKTDGNRTVAVYQSTMGESIGQKTFILRHFGEALEKHYIRVFFQPIVRTLTGRLCGLEALARWEDPKLGMISPAVFVPVLEEAQLINRLDRFVFERVVRLLRDRMDNGLPPIPVSINLSGYDFEVANPFDTIETLMERMQVPRSLICIEITERVMLRNRIGMTAAIHQFQDAGYQVWMDDFGNEYSSLNSLHNYHFDVIKIDMGFFSHFDDRSRQIIKAVVIMSKMLGVQTLAEGVETAEQVAFLERIGCGRIQGYYYGRPMILEDVLESLYRKGISAESTEEEELLDAAEQVNVATETPTAIFHFDGKQIRLLVENDAYCRELRSTGTQDTEEANANLNASGYPFRGRFIQLLTKAFQSRAEETLIYEDNGQYLKVTVRWLAGRQESWVGTAHIYNISSKPALHDAAEWDKVLRDTFQLYDGVYLIDRGKDEIRVLQSSNGVLPHEGSSMSVSEYAANFAGTQVYPDDRERFLTFLQPEHLAEEMRRTENVHTADLFRIRKEDGSFRWTVFEALRIYKSLTHNILLCEREDIWERKKDRKELLPVFCRSFGVEVCSGRAPAVIRDSSLFRTLCLCSPYRFLWKDREGHILGASTAFLRQMGIRDESVLLGRTETELGWQIDSASSQRDEQDVLRKGRPSSEITEQIVSGGHIIRSRVDRVPWYEEKEVAGVMEFFHSGAPEEQETDRLGLLDADTGCLSYRGALGAGLQYGDQYRLHHIDYAGILLDVPVYAGTMREDPDKAQEILRGFAQFLRETMSPGWIIARIGLCCFLCFCQRSSAGDAEEKMDAAAEMLRQLWRKQGLKTTPDMARAVAFRSEVSGLDDLLRLLYSRLSKAGKLIAREHLTAGDHIVFRRDALDAMPESIVVSDPKTYELLYLNQIARRDTKIGPEEPLTGKYCYEVLEGKDAPCGDCPNLMLRRDRVYAATHLSGRTEENLLIRSLLIPWEGRSLRFTIAFHLSEYMNTLAKDHELIYQEARANEAISVGMAEENPDRGIEKIIECISQNLKPERFLIFEEREDNTVSATYEWTAPGVMPLQDDLQSLSRTGVGALYRAFALYHVVLVSDIAAFKKENPDFSLPIYGIRSFVSGQLTLQGRTEGFTMVINPQEDTFRLASLLLSTLTDFIAIMIRNRNSMHMLEKQSMLDQMTGAGNRRMLEQTIREWGGNGSLGVISIDLNGLKNVNDSQGHHAGDMLICNTARILRECAGEKCVYRTGGDEFVVVTENMQEKDVLMLIQHIRESAERNGISLAAGYAYSNGKECNFDRIMTEADFNMYKDKGHSYRRRRTD